MFIDYMVAYAPPLNVNQK